MASPNANQTSRKRGRRAGISREMVLRAALEIAESEGAEPISLNAVARRLHVTPMAIYSYFANRDELLQALAAALLDGLVISLPPDTSPIRTVEIWAYTIRDHFLKHPQLISMLIWEGGHTSVAWLNQSTVLVEALGALGLEGAELGQTLLWIWSVVMGAIHTELFDLHSPIGMQDWEIDNLSPVMKRTVQYMRQSASAPDHHGRFFSFQLARLIDALEQQLQRARPSPQ